MEGSAEETLDDDVGLADPSVQLEMEIRGMRTSTGSVEVINGNGHKIENAKGNKEDVEMS
jgi:hypothetical protein